MMRGLVFIYQEERSFKNKLFTVRIEDRKKTGGIWVPVGGERVYTARDLQRPGFNIIDKTLFSMVFKSETDFRKSEGRFFSLDEEYTMFRVSPYDLKAFLNQSRRTGVLCEKNGTPIHFDYVEKVVPQIEFKKSENGFIPAISLKGRPLGSGYGMLSNPVRIVWDNQVYEMVRGVPASVMKNLISGGIIHWDEYDAVLKELSQYLGKLDINLPGKKQKTIIQNTCVTPVIDLDTSFRFASLQFMYDELGLSPFAMEDKRTTVFNHKKNIVLHRNFQEENAFRNKLENLGATYRTTSHGQWFIPKGKREKMLYELKGNGFLIKVSGKPLVLDFNIEWQIKVKEKRLSVGGTVCHSETKTGMGNILDAYLCGQLWFDLPQGLCGYLPKHLIQNLRRLEQRGDFRDENIRFEHYDFSFVAQAFREQKNVFQDQTFDAYLSFLKQIDDPGHQTKIPKSLKAELRPYQKSGFRWLAGLQGFGFGGILADDMGLGKTIQVLTLLLYLKEKSPDKGVSLLVVPKTLIWNWELEIKKFAPGLTIKNHTGPARDNLFSDLSGIDLVITSYGIVRQDIDLLSQVAWDFLVLDEAQAIKNPNSKISKAVGVLKSSNRLSLTGTPIENRPLDLWSQFNFLMPGFLGDKESFQKTYGQQNREALNTLGILTAPFILRRMKKQVCKELPDKTQITMLCDFSEEQKACYDGILTAGRHRLLYHSKENPPGKSRSIQALTMLLRLRQAACHPGLVSASDSYTGSSGKFEAVLETALEILNGGYKILIFSQFVALLELVRKMFAQHGVEQHILYGSTRQRKEVINRFKLSDSPSVFLISLKTGGLGLNLTEAGYVFLLDPWWNPAIENQAIDRSYRIGQENPVTVYRFITKNSVEENVSRLKERKRQLGKAVLGKGESESTPFSEKELLALIGEQEFSNWGITEA